MFGLAEWGARWAFGEPRPDELDPTVLMWWMRGGIDPAPFGDRRVVAARPAPGRAPRRGTGSWWDPHDVSSASPTRASRSTSPSSRHSATLYQMWEGVMELAVRCVTGGPADGRRDVVLRLSGSVGAHRG